MEWLVETKYIRWIEAPTKEEAEEIAMKDPCNQEGLAGEWIWNEYVRANKKPH